ncbi:hypothetical protein ATO9_07110 [Pseudooceanicola atlanticus]|uniref:Uncharacterized protein n=1 Tax=Pseudooceanicola atlanticus TaxID=1461694 RepID=A0A0A0EI45_9RHOB|nr:hypothetical protein ATO9_07110 [Pseudooceanicola atlanticus]
MKRVLLDCQTLHVTVKTLSLAAMAWVFQNSMKQKSKPQDWIAKEIAGSKRNSLSGPQRNPKT